MPMFRKILIANRGEIACRIMRTAHDMGIIPVAVCSDADADALHVRRARELGGEVCPIGPPPAAESYLSIGRIIAACRDSGAEAVHPGYGFLSENRDFVAALDAAGVTFIGPPADAIAAMGDKIRSKIIAEKAGVTIVPGSGGAIDDPEEGVRVAREIGYPVMLKASAGGGGKGMRLVRDDESCRAGLASAMGEAERSFGDARVFIEKYIEEPRHIEIQILADRHGNRLALGERECTLQRRHQKVIEEAPSAFLDPATRKAMAEQAVALAAAVDYHSAGTVEFIVDRARNFYFLEMNTRLQVEHPVTEYVTGLDLVAWMIRIAQGEKLTLRPRDVAAKGWAIEARIYAEDPERGFLPSVGRLVRYREPDTQDDADLRVDSGCREGGEITPFYDPMIAKLIAYGPDRAQALRRLRRALDGWVVRGIATNQAFLAQLARHPRFADGDFTTDFIATEYPHGLTPALLQPQDPELFAAVACFMQRCDDDRADNGQDGQDGPVADGRAADYAVFLDVDNKSEIAVCLEPAGGECGDRGDGGDRGDRGDAPPTTTTVTMQAQIGDRRLRLTGPRRGAQALLPMRIDDEERIFQLDRVAPAWILHHGGARVRALVLAARHAPLMRLMPEKRAPDLSAFLLSPMPGQLLRLTVKAGERIKAGQELAVVEAMKMENSLRATRDARVKTVYAAPGDTLAVDQKILEFAGTEA